MNIMITGAERKRSAYMFPFELDGREFVDDLHYRTLSDFITLQDPAPPS